MPSSTDTAAFSGGESLTDYLSVGETIQAGGRLTLDDSHGAVSLALAGSYDTANFAMAADGHGGTEVTFHG